MAHGQGAPPVPAEEPSPDSVAQPVEPREPPIEDADDPDVDPDPVPEPVPEPQPSPEVTPEEGDDDDWGLEDGEEGGYEPPFVKADFSKPQPEGYVHEPAHDHRWFFHNLTGVRVNPLGLTNRIRTGYKMQLSHRPEAIFKESFATIELDTEITPAFGYVGGRMEIQPAKIFNFWASYGMMGTFGSFSYTRSFPNAQADYRDTRLEDSRDQDYTSLGHRASVSGMFQFGLGGVAMRDNVQGHYHSQDLKDGDKVFWDATLDVLIPNSGWTVTNDADLLVMTEFDLIVGVRYTMTHAVYRDEHLDGKNVNTPTHRVGPALIYQFFDDGEGTQWNKPTLVLLAQWWAKHRFRTDEAPALPYLVLAFVQQGDLMISEKK